MCVCGWGGYSDSWCSGEKLTITGKAGNLLHSAEEVDVNEPLIAGEETLNGTRIHMQAHTGGRMLANTCLHTHTLLMKPLLLIMNYYPDIDSSAPSLIFFLRSLPPASTWCVLKKNRQFSSRAEKSPVLDLAYQLDSHPLSLSSPSSLFASCHAQTVFQSFWIPSFCISTHTLLSHPPSQLPLSSH